MKQHISFFILIFLIIISCRKDRQIEEELPTENPETVEVDSLKRNGYKFNYIKIQVAGKTFVAKDDFHTLQWGSTVANLKRNSNNEVIDWKGDIDSITYFRKYTISNDSTCYVHITFTKKFAKKDCNYNFSMYTPKARMDLFPIGLQQFSTDFERDKNYDGIILDLRIKEGKEFISYSTTSNQFPSLPTTITRASHKESTFEIARIKSSFTRGEYLEADFRCKIFDKNEEVSHIDKGFFRLQLIENF